MAKKDTNTTEKTNAPALDNNLKGVYSFKEARKGYDKAEVEAYIKRLVSDHEAVCCMFRDKLDSVNAENALLIHENADLREAAQQKNDPIKEEVQVSDVGSQVSDVGLGKNLKDALLQLQIAQDKIDFLESSLSAQKDKCGALEMEKQQITTELSQAIADAAQLQTVLARMDTVSEEKEIIQTQLAVYQQQIDTLQKKADALDAIRSENNSLKLQLDAVNSMLESARSTILAEKESADAAVIEKERAEARAANAAERVTFLEKKTKELEGSIAEALEENRKIRREYAEKENTAEAESSEFRFAAVKAAEAHVRKIKQLETILIETKVKFDEISETYDALDRLLSDN